jgi:hypothetical protein
VAEIKRVRVTCESIKIVKVDSDEDQQCDLYGDLGAYRVSYQAGAESFLDTKLFWHRGPGSDDYQGIGQSETHFVNTSHEMFIVPGEFLWLSGNLSEWDPFDNDHLGNVTAKIPYADIGNQTYTLDFTGSGGHVQVIYSTILL